MHSVQHCERPEFDVGDIGPVNSRMVKHRACNRQHCSNAMLHNAIRMVCSNSRMVDLLVEHLQVFIKLGADELGSIVAEVGLWNHSMVSTELLEFFLHFKSLMGVESGLKYSEHETSGMVDEEAASLELLVGGFLSVGVQQAAQRVAEVVVD